MATLRSALSDSMFVEGLRKVFFLEYDELESVHPQVYIMETSNKRQETDHTIPSLGMLTEKEEGVSMEFEDLVDGYFTRAHVKSPIINGESLNSNASMVTLSKQERSVQLQRLNLVTA